MWSQYNNLCYNIIYDKIFKTMKDYLEKIEQKCRENNITFIGFANENNEYRNNKTKLILKCSELPTN